MDIPNHLEGAISAIRHPLGALVYAFQGTVSRWERKCHLLYTPALHLCTAVCHTRASAQPVPTSPNTDEPGVWGPVRPPGVRGNGVWNVGRTDAENGTHNAATQVERGSGLQQLGTLIPVAKPDAHVERVTSRSTFFFFKQDAFGMCSLIHPAGLPTSSG